MSLRLSRAIMGKTKAELVEMVEQLEADDLLKIMLDSIRSTETRVRGYHELASAAWARLMCVATVVSLKQEEQAMTETNPRHSNLASVIVDMEDNLRAVKRWGEVLIIMSGSCHAVSEDALATNGSVLHELGGSIEEQYERPFVLSH